MNPAAELRPARFIFCVNCTMTISLLGMQARGGSRLNQLQPSSDNRRTSFVLGRPRSTVLSRHHHDTGLVAGADGTVAGNKAGGSGNLTAVPLAALVDALVELAALPEVQSDHLIAHFRRTIWQLLLTYARWECTLLLSF